MTSTGPGTPVLLHRSRFDGSRLRWQVRGPAVLVMDRLSGRWLSIDRQWADVLPMLGVEDPPDAALPVVRRLRRSLEQNQIGLRGSERHFEALNTVILKLTAACNHACEYCYDFEPEDGARRVDHAVAAEAISQALDIAPAALQVILHGGEPMLVWPLVERIVLEGERLAAERGAIIRFVGQTNMSRVTERVVRFSVAHDIDWGVSVDGPAELHDRYRTRRDGSGTYAEFEASLRRFPDFVRACGVMSTVTTANHDRLPDVVRHVRDLGMGSWDWSLFQPLGRAREQPDRFEPDVDLVVRGWHDIFDLALGGEFDGLPVLPILKYVENFTVGVGRNMCMRGECGAGRDLLSISADGTIEACDCLDPHGPLGGLGRVASPTSLVDALASPTAGAIRARDVSSTPCGECIWWGICGGGCMAHAPERDSVPELGCALALAAFDRIADELTMPGSHLQRYLDTIPTGMLGTSR